MKDTLESLIYDKAEGNLIIPVLPYVAVRNVQMNWTSKPHRSCFLFLKKNLKSDQLTGNSKQGVSQAAVLNEIPSICFSLPSPFHIFLARTQRSFSKFSWAVIKKIKTYNSPCHSICHSSISLLLEDRSCVLAILVWPPSLMPCTYEFFVFNIGA